MAVRTKDEILEMIKEKIGEDTSDETITLIEDVTDTLNDYETRTSGGEDWKAKYEENDASWRRRYTDRFFNKNSEEITGVAEETADSGELTEKVSYEDLFKEGD